MSCHRMISTEHLCIAHEVTNCYQYQRNYKPLQHQYTLCAFILTAYIAARMTLYKIFDVRSKCHLLGANFLEVSSL